MARSFIGIDVGNEMANLAFRSGDGVRFVSRALPENAVNDGQVVSPEVVAESLKKLRADEKIHGRNCSLILHSYNEYFRHATLPVMNDSELRLNLPYEFRDFITDDPANYSFDYAVDKVDTDDDGTPTGIEVFAAAARHDALKQMDGILHRAGFRLRIVNPSPMAFMTMLADHVARHPEAADSSVALIDIGYTQMSVSLFAGTHYEGSRLVDMGVHDVDAAISEAYNIDQHVARTYRAQDYEGVLETARCQAVYDRMVFEVSKVVNFYNFSNQAGDIERMYLLGTGASINQLVAAMLGGFDQPVYEVTELMPQELRDTPDAAVCARAYAALLCGEATVHGA